MEYKFKFTIITAVYNTESYIDEMIRSILNQSIGFEENIQLILIDDESNDESYCICDKYKKMFPENILVKSVKHSGVSNARNIGLDYREGKYINFLDSDDRLEHDALEKVYKFFEINYDEIDVLSIPMCFFDREEGNHILNYKYQKNSIVDLHKQHKYIQLSSSSAFIKEMIIKDLKFDCNLVYGEDAKFMSNIVLRKMKYGVIADTKYYYRRRNDESSAIQACEGDSRWYLGYIEDFSLKLINEQIDDFGKVSKYAQYLIMYDLQWRINRLNSKTSCIKGIERLRFVENLIKVLNNVSAKIIFEQDNMRFYRKILLIIIKKSKIKCLKKFFMNLI